MGIHELLFLINRNQIETQVLQWSDPKFDCSSMFSTAMDLSLSECLSSQSAETPLQEE